MPHHASRPTSGAAAIHIPAAYPAIPLGYRKQQQLEGQTSVSYSTRTGWASRLPPPAIRHSPPRLLVSLAAHAHAAGIDVDPELLARYASAGFGRRCRRGTAGRLDTCTCTWRAPLARRPAPTSPPCITRTSPRGSPSLLCCPRGVWDAPVCGTRSIWGTGGDDEAPDPRAYVYQARQRPRVYNARVRESAASTSSRRCTRFPSSTRRPPVARSLAVRLSCETAPPPPSILPPRLTLLHAHLTHLERLFPQRTSPASPAFLVSLPDPARDGARRGVLLLVRFAGGAISGAQLAGGRSCEGTQGRPYAQRRGLGMGVSEHSMMCVTHAVCGVVFRAAGRDMVEDARSSATI
ncbi:hypothetical protein C8R47DRAFT_288594 [Mycena vitilis]|nr:hypothetical protein C8R47DRAFT_288594 [Mycena vitilis]